MISEQAAFFSPGDMLIVMAVALVVFGPKKLPEVGRQIGQAVRELKRMTGELTDSINNETKDIRHSFDDVSSYTVKPSPVDNEPKLLGANEGYSKGGLIQESSLLSSEDGEVVAVETSTVPIGQEDAAKVPLTSVSSKAGDEVQ
jgi:TatA/E family protein of Tat protein translocase